MTSNRRTKVWWAAGTLATLVALVLAASVYFRLPPDRLARQSARVVATPVLAVAYREDLEFVRKRSLIYLHGWARQAHPDDRDVSAAWRAAATSVPGIRLEVEQTDAWDGSLPPFVHEDPDAPFLVALRERYGLRELVASEPTEYEAILKLGGWIGRQFGHGLDPVVGSTKVCDPVGLIEAGRAGERYWCETAARLMVHAATSLGFPARVITASTDGYTWEHAVAEIWSNEFRKWFMVDTDFNMVFERFGTPLSAVDLMEHGAEWDRAGELVVRPVAPEKDGAPRTSNPPRLYGYVHVDMRTDWCTRPLRRGSPAGGDRATVWAARNDFGAVLTAIPRAEDPAEMQWQVNRVALRPVAVERSSAGLRIELALGAYSPTFAGFEIREGDQPWSALPGDRHTLLLGNGEHRLAARVRTRNGFPGPAANLRLLVGPGAGTTGAGR